MSKWIKERPPGEYDIKQLKKFSGVHCHSSIKHTMLRYGATIIHILCIHSNLLKNVFQWKGYQDIKRIKP